jgi:uncharacterized integral membrane protein
MGDEEQPVEGGREPARTPAEPARTPLSQTIGRVVIVVLVVLFAVFAVANAQHVDFSWLFGETQVQVDRTGERISGGVPLILLLAATFVIGLMLGLVIAWQSARSRRRAERKR